MKKNNQNNLDPFFFVPKDRTKVKYKLKNCKTPLYIWHFILNWIFTVNIFFMAFYLLNKLKNHQTRHPKIQDNYSSFVSFI